MLCLEIWSGLDCSPHIHSIHFCYAFGAFLAPLLASPFLSHRVYTGKRKHYSVTPTNITTLYPIIGLATIIMSVG